MQRIIEKMKQVGITKSQDKVIYKVMKEAGLAGLDVGSGYELWQYDVDKDGKCEAIVRYFINSSKKSGVKVFKFNGDAYTLIFEYDSNSPRTVFEVLEGVPTISADSESSLANGRRIRYEWNGKEFKLRENW